MMGIQSNVKLLHSCTRKTRQTYLGSSIRHLLMIQFNSIQESIQFLDLFFFCSLFILLLILC